MSDSIKFIYNKPYKEPSEIVKDLSNEINVIHEKRLSNIIELFGYEVISYYLKISIERPYDREEIIYNRISETFYRYTRDLDIRKIVFSRCVLFESLFKSCLTHNLSIFCKDSDDEYKHHPYYNCEIYRGCDNDKKNKTKNIFLSFLSRIYPSDSKNLDIKFYREKYCYPPYPPIWELLNMLTLGQVVFFYKKLSPTLRKEISLKFGVDEIKVFESWLNNVVHLRNESAHKGRMFNIELKVKNRIYNKKNIPKSNPHSLHSILEVLDYLVEQRCINLCGTILFPSIISDLGNLLKDEMVIG